MVVFTCGHCGESVQKPKVEKHYQTKCRNRNPNLSCMDCFKDFFGKDYESHIKCITEEERYSAKGFQAKEKKGEKKQNTWVEMLQEVLAEQPYAPGNVLRIIETVSKHNNTPRKKPKFINFVKNVCGHKTNPKDIDQAWELISVKLSALSLANQQNKNQKKDDSAEESGKQEDKNDSQDDSVANGDTEAENTENKVDMDEENDAKEATENSDENPSKKLSKNAKRKEKRQKKYEAELQSAGVPHVEEEETAEPSKKGKKKKSKSECSNGEVEENEQDGKKKNKKRKRQDTANSLTEVQDKVEDKTDEPPVVARVSKKKVKVAESDELEDSVCLHDQNVAKIEELSMNTEFNWHAVIKSVLQKKDNELPFKRLQKKVLMEYSDFTGREVDDRIADKFIKKLKSAPNVRVDKNRVTLLE
ncbi:LYAR-type c2HC zinc finger domain-containing protein [Phthorimaea operculella]|nr:LYAR-type c2HC zinc finger domain-containing protein [Phthorimaea operculella]